MPIDLLANGTAAAAPGWGGLKAAWTVEMGEGEMRFFSGFTLGVYAPRTGKKASCSSGYTQRSNVTTLQGCFLDCARDGRCENVLLGAVPNVGFTVKPPAISCTLLGAVEDPSSACKVGAGTLVKKLPNGRECWGRWAEEGESAPLVTNAAETLLPAMGPRC